MTLPFIIGLSMIAAGLILGIYVVVLIVRQRRTDRNLLD
jgi:hypothetical protein